MGQIVIAAVVSASYIIPRRDPIGVFKIVTVVGVFITPYLILNFVSEVTASRKFQCTWNSGVVAYFPTIKSASMI